MTSPARAFAAALLATSILLGACQSAGRTERGAPITYNPATGRVTTTLEASLDKAWEASHEAVDGLQFEVVEENRDALQGIIVAEMADDETVRINLERISDNVTRASVGTGAFGDERTARLVLDEIMKNL